MTDITEPASHCLPRFEDEEAGPVGRRSRDPAPASRVEGWRQLMVERLSLVLGLRRFRRSATALGSATINDSAVFETHIRGHRVVSDGRRIQVILRPNDPAGDRRQKGKFLTAIAILFAVLLICLTPALFFAAGFIEGLWFLGVAAAVAIGSGVAGRHLAPNDADETEEWLLFELRPEDNEVYDRYGKLPFRLDQVTFSNAPPAAHPLFGVLARLTSGLLGHVGHLAFQPTPLMMKAPWYHRPLLPLGFGRDYDNLVLHDLPSALPGSKFRVWPSSVGQTASPRPAGSARSSP